MTPELRALLERHPAPWKVCQLTGDCVRDANGGLPFIYGDQEADREMHMIARTAIVDLVNRAAEVERG